MSDTADVHKMPLLDHLIELRQRMLYSFIALFVAFLVCFYFAQELFDVLVQPLADILIAREHTPLRSTRKAMRSRRRCESSVCSRALPRRPCGRTRACR